MNRIILTIIIFILHVCDVSYGARLSFNKERIMKKHTPTPTSIPTIIPTSIPTIFPTSLPTITPTLMPFSFDQCEGSEDDVDRFRPRSHRKGRRGQKKRFRFNHVQSNAQCVNDKNLVYEGGEFEDCREFSVCAELCVNQVDENLARGGRFRGFEWYCPERTCYCVSGPLDVLFAMQPNTHRCATE